MEQVDLTNMCMILDGKGNVLVQERIKNWCGIAFPGGHVEKGESLIESTIREIKEETGLTILNLEICGFKNFFDFKKNYRYMVFLFKTSTYTGPLLEECPEGRNFWMPISKLKEVKLSESFDITIDNIYLGDKKEIFYSNQNKDWDMFIY